MSQSGICAAGIPSRRVLCGFRTEERSGKGFPPRKKQNAFTLIELLVVVTIISLLVSILLPSLQKAKDLAKQVLCSSQMHQIGLALAVYAADHDDFFPPHVEVLWGGMARWEHLALPLMEIGAISDQGMFTCPAGFFKPLLDREIGYYCRWGINLYHYSLRDPPGIVLVTEPCGWWKAWSHPPHWGTQEESGFNVVFPDGVVEYKVDVPPALAEGFDGPYNNWWRAWDRPDVPFQWYVDNPSE